MSISGTHDSGATHSIFDVSGKCQELNIKQQLNVGVRFFDLRLLLDNDDFRIIHGPVDQKLPFDNVLKDLTSFISTYDSEFIIISIKQESSDINSTKSFEEVLLEKLQQYEELISFNNTLPQTVKEARGKIHILSRYNLSFGYPSYYGWSDDTTFTLDDLYVQDNYCVNSIEEKMEDIKATINVSNSETNDKLVLNFTSCYLDVPFPPTYAGEAAKHINPWLIDYINENDSKLGIIVSDFISKELAISIYRRNY
jgi:1-phosphatidylinositol phosphodiesterase